MYDTEMCLIIEVHVLRTKLQQRGEMTMLCISAVIIKRVQTAMKLYLHTAMNSAKPRCIETSTGVRYGVLLWLMTVGCQSGV